MKKSYLWILIGIVVLVILISLLVVKPWTKKEIFTPQQTNQLKVAASEYSSSGGRIANKLFDFFEKTDLETSLKVCEQGQVMEKDFCYRTLAISQPENKEVVCGKVLDSGQRESCLLLVPFLM